MNFDEYNSAINYICLELDKLSEQTAQQALTGYADPSNPLFVNIMVNQTRLITLAAKLNEIMLSKIQKHGHIEDTEQ